MKAFSLSVGPFSQITIALVILFTFAAPSYSQLAVTTEPAFYGPYNAIFLPDGDGLHKPLVKDDSILRADSPWSLYAWVKPVDSPKASTVIAGVGDPSDEFFRGISLDNGHVLLSICKDNSLSASASLAPGTWHFLAATFNGNEFALFVDGAKVASGKLDVGSISPVLEIAPPAPPSTNWQHFGGTIASLTLLRKALTPDEIKQLSTPPGDFANAEFEEGSKPWPVQTRGQAGYRAPQDPSTMPRSKAPFSRPEAKPLHAQEIIQANGDSQWTLAAGWTMLPAPKVSADGAAISQPNFKTSDWMSATVPGTALTTMVDRGIYPDPDYGLNNLSIPESLNKQDYWYRVEFHLPKQARDRRLTLAFEGINYAASVWLNGQALGSIKGAFIRGVFDVTSIAKPDRANVLAVRVSPPPHPAIPQEQSIKGGPGENGGIMCLDGPTFVATEGWDWIPAIRDRDTGIWQPVTLTATSTVKIGDAQVVTTLPLPDTSRADVEIAVPLENLSNSPVTGILKASLGDILVTKQVTVEPGKSLVMLTPSEFSQLTVKQPRLWWPNGYGKPELYNLQLSLSIGGAESDRKQVRFGIREITYELSLLDSTGHLRRLEYAPTTARSKGERVIDIRHEGIREIPAADPYPADLPPEGKDDWKSWVSSLAPGGESSPAVRMLDH